MNKKISVGMMLTIVILAMTVTFSVTMLLAMRLFDSTVSNVKEKESMYSKISELDRYVRSNDYYTIDESVLYDTIASGYLLGTGDRYARYYTAQAYTELLDVQNGVLMGIGVELAQDQTGYAKVLKVYDGSPAQEAGITAGNYITAIDGEDVKTISGAEAIQARLRGEAGTTVNLTWLDSESTEQTLDLTRSGYITTTVDYQMTAGNVGYIKIRQFDSTTLSELDYAIRTLRNAGAASLLFDLRDNAGGLLDVALNCIDLVCPEGVMAWAESRDGTREALGSSSDVPAATNTTRASTLPIGCAHPSWVISQANATSITSVCVAFPITSPPSSWRRRPCTRGSTAPSTGPFRTRRRADACGASSRSSRTTPNPASTRTSPPPEHDHTPPGTTPHASHATDRQARQSTHASNPSAPEAPHQQQSSRHLLTGICERCGFFGFGDDGG